VPLDEYVGVLGHGQHRGDGRRVLQVKGYQALSAVEVVLCRLTGEYPQTSGPLDADHVGAHVRERHPGEWSRTHAADLQDANTV
jgi:hypothetical protein